LLEQVAGVDGLERIRFLTGHPRDMHPHLMDAIGRLDKVCPWLHVPAQSGSDAVLRRMKRLYTAGQYLEMVDYARRAIPGVTFSSDFIVGFPGETEADFRATLDLVQRVQYDQIFSFKYSERPGVPAARLADDVPAAAKKERLAELVDAQQGIWARLAAAQVGLEVTAVGEGPARRPVGAWRLRTANNRKVIVSGPQVAPGERVTVRLTGWDATTFFGERLGA
ncbi:radical SAM protein, partial [bacterium]|nr:radical SAM protein [bacterium]